MGLWNQFDVFMYLMNNFMNDELEQKEDFTFEDFRIDNGISFWWASELMRMLGYDSMKKFEKVIYKVTKIFITIEIPHYEHIIPMPKEDTETDYKLTRLACHLIAMQADATKPEVAMVQTYFANVLSQRQFQQDANDIERLLIREELSEGTKSLNSIAKDLGVENYAFFTDKGYVGLYNMKANELKSKRGLRTKDNLADYMSRTELAANLFRVTLTEENIKTQKIKGQRNLENTHYNVGRDVRNMVIKNTGTTPENLPQEAKLPDIKKELKTDYKKLLGNGDKDS